MNKSMCTSKHATAVQGLNFYFEITMNNNSHIFQKDIYVFSCVGVDLQISCVMNLVKRRTLRADERYKPHKLTACKDGVWETRDADTHINDDSATMKRASEVLRSQMHIIGSLNKLHMQRLICVEQRLLWTELRYF